jgi:MYXO-CTERM domain-containing protein
MDKLVRFGGTCAAALIALAFSARAASAAGECRVVDVDFTPSEQLQLVAWIEDAAGNYVDTAFITQTTGLRGLGNRTGVMGLNSGPTWPYGDREDVLPIWAHSHGLTFPAVVFQSSNPVDDCNMSRPFAESSTEQYYCRPMQPSEPAWDTGSCASTIFTDKGTFSQTTTSVYPPRGDIVRAQYDSASVDEFAEMNPFDTVSQATPAGDAPYRFTWQVPPDLAAGSYVLRIEVGKEFDFNTTYTEATYPSTQCSFTSFGMPYRGQPSVLYAVPFTLGTATSTSTLDYAGYSDLDGALHAPDATITTDTPGSGASRLRVAIADDSSTYRVRATTRIEDDAIAPFAVGEPTITVEATSAKLAFTAPGDDGDVGTVAGFEIRYLIGDQLDETSFASADRVLPVAPVAPGLVQKVTLANLIANTPYVVGIRAYDNCGHTGPLVIARFETPTVDVGCGCRTTNPGGVLCLAIVLLAFGVRRRRLR